MSKNSTEAEGLTRRSQDASLEHSSSWWDDQQKWRKGGYSYRIVFLMENSEIMDGATSAEEAFVGLCLVLGSKLQPLIIAHL